jgi:hypothetical protein
LIDFLGSLDYNLGTSKDSRRPVKGNKSSFGAFCEEGSCRGIQVPLRRNGDDFGTKVVFLSAIGR